MDRRCFLGLTASALTLGAHDLGRPILAADAPAGFFRDGDRVVMIGDSITEQLLHSNYVEAFVVSRHPTWSLAFRNVGIGGDTSTGGNRRTVRDILTFQPTACTITFGMNDGGYRQPPDPARLQAYVVGLKGMAEQLKAAKVRTAILSSSPVEKKEDGSALEGYNQTLETFAANAKAVADENGFTFVDQFHPHVAALQKARDRDPKLRINGGDAVHPGATGQYLMAWAILKGLGAGPLVTEAAVDAGRRRAGKAVGCKISKLKSERGGISFERADDALPWHIDPRGRAILEWVPIVEELNRYVLRVTGLKSGSYNIRIDDEMVLTTDAAALAQGVNLAMIDAGPIASQAKAVHDAVVAKNRYYHDQIFRGVVLNGGVPEADKAKLIEERAKGQLPLEEAVRTALALRPHQWSVTSA